MWVRYNPNPTGARLGDCAVRAIAAALGLTWEWAYDAIAVLGMEMHDMPSSNAVWGECLRRNGYTRKTTGNACPDCVTVRDYAAMRPHGTYVLALDRHVVTMIDGDWLDTWDSGDEAVLYVYRKEE